VGPSFKSRYARRAAAAAPLEGLSAMTPNSDFLSDLLRPERLTAVVDIGANPITTDGDPPYRPMLVGRLCTLVGFEPQPDALAALNARKSDLETYLPYAVGDGSTGILKLCLASGKSSLLTPEPRVLACFPHFSEFGEVVREIPVETRALDGIAEIGALDFLKIDIQGGELVAFRNGSARLAGAVVVHTEVSFVPFYKNQPAFGDIDLALRALGFLPHMFASLNKRLILPLQRDGDRYAAINQILEADVVYVRDFTQPDSMSAEQLKHLALVARHCHQSYDLAAKCIHHLALRNSAPAGAVELYLNAIQGR
jgi:FkbM family methyltransferase